MQLPGSRDYHFQPSALTPVDFTVCTTGIRHAPARERCRLVTNTLNTRTLISFNLLLHVSHHSQLPSSGIAYTTRKKKARFSLFTVWQDPNSEPSAPGRCSSSSTPTALLLHPRPEAQGPAASFVRQPAGGCPRSALPCPASRAPCRAPSPRRAHLRAAWAPCRCGPWCRPSARRSPARSSRSRRTWRRRRRRRRRQGGRRSSQSRFRVLLAAKTPPRRPHGAWHRVPPHFSSSSPPLLGDGCGVTHPAPRSEPLRLQLQPWRSGGGGRPVRCNPTCWKTTPWSAAGLGQNRRIL